MFVVVPRVVRLVVLFTLAQLFWACGGGGDKADTTPNSFSFTSQTNVALDTTATSNGITVTGINRDTAISITGGEYRVNSGAFVSASGTVSKDDTVTVRLTSASTISTSRTASLTIGGVSANFMVTTVGDIFPPTATVYFPTPNVLTEGTTLPIRGVASDEHSGIASINVVVSPDDGTTETQNITLTPTGGADLAEGWSTDLTLSADAVNTVSVYALDTEGNRQTNPTVVRITQSSAVANFPEGSDSVGDDTFGVVNMSFSPEGSELWVPVSNASASALMAVNLETGERGEVYSKMELGNTGNSCNGVSYYEPLNTVVMACENDILRVNLNNGSVTGLPDLTDLGYDGATYSFISRSAAKFYSDQVLGVVEVVNFDDVVFPAFPAFNVIRLDEGIRSAVAAFSLNSVSIEVESIGYVFIGPEGDAIRQTISTEDWQVNFSDNVRPLEANSILVDSLSQGELVDVVVVTEDYSIYSLDFSLPEDADETLISSNALTGLEANPLQGPVGILNDSEKRLSYIIDSTASVPFSVILVDLESGHRVVQSRSVASVM